MLEQRDGERVEGEPPSVAQARRGLPVFVFAVVALSAWASFSALTSGPASRGSGSVPAALESVRDRVEAVQVTAVASTVDEALAELSQLDAEAVARARAAHVPLSDGPQAADALADEIVDRWVAITPALAPHVGEHVHPGCAGHDGVEEWARGLLQLEDLRRRLDSGEIRARNAHERTDLAYLRDLVERAWLTRDANAALRALIQGPWQLVYLTHFDCCDVDLRATDALAFVRRVEERLDALDFRHEEPRRMLLDIALRRFKGHEQFVAGLSSSFASATPAIVSQIDAAATDCIRAYGRVAARLRSEIRPTADARPGMDPEY